MQHIWPERLLVLRKIRKLSQERLAELAGVSPRSIVRKEPGGKEAVTASRKKTVIGLADALKVNPNVLTGDAPMPEELLQRAATLGIDQGLLRLAEAPGGDFVRPDYVQSSGRDQGHSESTDFSGGTGFQPAMGRRPPNFHTGKMPALPGNRRSQSARGCNPSFARNRVVRRVFGRSNFPPVRNLSTTLRQRRLGFTEQAEASQPRPGG